MAMKSHLRVAYVVDPRFLGGTSAAVAAELRECVKLARVSVHAIESRMFLGRTIAPPLEQALGDLGLELIWDSKAISADVVILHNPSFLKFQFELGTRILARHLIVVTHENFLRPGQAEAFDVGRCLDQIDRASTALRKSIAPVSTYNRRTVLEWLQTCPPSGSWRVLEADWFNICEFPRAMPTAQPSDRRGRHSRPGFEKFPILADMDLCFPEHANANIILGADTYRAAHLHRPHWTMYPFQGIDLAQYFELIDFMVYFTAPTWRESFGRVLAEAIAAGKIVISDPATASNFDGAVVAGTPAEIDTIIKRFIDHPALYAEQVTLAQSKLEAFSGTAFRAQLLAVLDQTNGAAE